MGLSLPFAFLCIRADSMARVASGCGVEKSIERFDGLLIPVMVASSAREASRTWLGHAFSLYAAASLEMYQEGNGVWRTTLAIALTYADKSARFGFVSQAVLDVAEAGIRTLGRPMLNMFSALKKAYQDYCTQAERKSRSCGRTFPCAAGCGIAASKPSGLRRCMGKCPAAFKPSYCSKDCQALVSPA